MGKVTIIKSSISPFFKHGEFFVGDIHQLRLMHVNSQLEASYSSIYDYKLTPRDNKRVEWVADINHKSLTPENIKWKPVEMEKYNIKLREELENSQLIICESELVKEFLNSILQDKKTIVSLVT